MSLDQVHIEASLSVLPPPRPLTVPFVAFYHVICANSFFILFLFECSGIIASSIMSSMCLNKPSNFVL